MSFSDENETKRFLKEQPFYNASVYKPKIKYLNDVNMLRELPFCDELNILKTAEAFMQEPIALKY